MRCGRKGFDSVMMKLLLTGIFLTELVKYGVWFKGIYGLSFSRRRWGSIVAGIFLFLIYIGIINEKSLLILWGIVDIIIFSIVIDCNKGERGFLIGQASFILISAGEVIGEVFQLIDDISVFKVEKIDYLFGDLIVVLILFVLCGIKKKINRLGVKEIGNLYRNAVYGAITLMGVVILVAVTGFQRVARLAGDRVNIFSQIISIVAYICDICLVMVISYVYNENKRYKIYLEKEAILVKTQKNMYESMLLKNEEIRQFRHDIQNHFICLNELAEYGEIKKVQSYITEITGKIHAIQGKLYSVGNGVVDVVLNYYISMLPDDVKVSIEGVCNSNICINDFELCTIISNLVQNAEEALKKDGIRERYLHIEFGNEKDYVWMKMQNSILEGSVLFDKCDTIPKTTKRNKNEHGMGMKNIKDVLIKNGGMLNIEVDKTEFRITILLPINPLVEFDSH